MIQDCPRHKKNEESDKSRKGGKRNGTHNTSTMKAKITKTAIAAFLTSHTDDDSIPTQVRMPPMGIKYGLMQLSLTIMSQLIDWGVQNSFISSMTTMAGFQVW